jgi:hypothetical protein
MIDHVNSKPAEARHSHPETRDGLRAALLELVRTARHEIAVAAPVLDAAVWNSAAMGEALAHLATRHGRNRIRVVVEDSEHLLATCARLVDLAHRLSDLVLIRRLGEPHRGLNELLVVADRDGCLVQADVGILDATLDLDTPRLAAPRLKRFEEIWEVADPLPGLHIFRP